MKNKIIFIAEAGINHNGSIKNALKLVDIASDSGADYVKFQITNSNLISKKTPKARYQKRNTNYGYCLCCYVATLRRRWYCV